jgi:hypothetical protein
MAEKITLAEWRKKNPNGTLKDFEEAGGKVNDLVRRAFAAAKNYTNTAFSGVTNSEGKSSLAENPVVQKVASAINKEKLEEATRKGKAKIIELEEKANEFYNGLEGKDKEEQQKLYQEKFQPEDPPPLSSVFYRIEKKDKPEEKTETKPEETPKESEKPKDYRNAYLESWAATHPTWGMILRDKNLTWGQKVALIGSALANIGANVTLGMKSGFEHSGFQPVEWDFKKAIDKYSNQDIENVLKAQQDQRAKKAIADFWSEYEAKHGKEATEELIALGDLYSDNPEMLKIRLSAMGINKSADEIKDLYANLEKTNLSESAKQKILETEAKNYENLILKLSADEKYQTNDKVIAAKNALSDLQTTSATFDEKTYKLRKLGGMVRDILETVEGAAATAGGVLTGGVVGKVRDGIIRNRGIPQKIVRADGSEVILSPYDNVYATEKPLTSDNDNGGEVVPMDLKDEVYFQKRLGYSGGVIRKDFDYYLNILRA